MPTVAVLIPHLPRRDGTLEYDECIRSVQFQTRQPDQLIIEADPDHTGAAATQNRGLTHVSSDYVALLGDDDYFLPNHLEILMSHAGEADVIWPDCKTVGADWNFCGEFNEERLRHDNYIPGGGSLIRTSAARAVGGWCKPGDPDFHKYEDWIMWKRLLDAGYRFKHIHEITWGYRFWNGQTAGQA